MSLTCGECGGEYKLNHGPYKDSLSKKVVVIDYLFCPGCGSCMFGPDACRVIEAAQEVDALAKLQTKHSLLVGRIKKAIAFEEAE